MQLRQNYKMFWDQLGISASFLCAIHCLSLPILLPILIGSSFKFFSTPLFEIGIIVFILSVGGYSITNGYLHVHRKIYPYYFLALGVLMIVAKTAAGERVEPFFIVLGALFLVSAHFLNWRLCRSCSLCHPEEGREE